MKRTDPRWQIFVDALRKGAPALAAARLASPNAKSRRPVQTFRDLAKRDEQAAQEWKDAAAEGKRAMTAAVERGVTAPGRSPVRAAAPAPEPPRLPTIAEVRDLAQGLPPPTMPDYRGVTLSERTPTPAPPAAPPGDFAPLSPKGTGRARMPVEPAPKREASSTAREKPAQCALTAAQRGTSPKPVSGVTVAPYDGPNANKVEQAGCIGGNLPSFVATEAADIRHRYGAHSLTFQRYARGHENPNGSVAAKIAKKRQRRLSGEL